MPLPIRLISSMATRQVLKDLLAQFQHTVPHVLAHLESVGGVDAARRVQAGEPFDAVVLASDAVDKLIAAGALVMGSRVDVVRSGVAVAVCVGAPRPDISSEQAVKQAVRSARSLACSTGPSGVALAGLFERWGIARDIAPRLITAPPGVPVGSLVARGEVELGFQQLSELINLQGITVLGPLPEAIQITTVFSAGLTANAARPEAARQLLAFLASPAARDAKLRQGMVPA